VCVYIDKSLRIGKDAASGDVSGGNVSVGATGNTFLLVSPVASGQSGWQCRAAHSFDDAKVLRQRRRLRVYSNFSRIRLVFFMDDGWQPDVTD